MRLFCCIIISQGFRGTLAPCTLTLLARSSGLLPLRQKDKKKSEPISDLENLVRIILVWCGRWDLNPYVIQHTPLKRACLPIPALPHIHFLHQRCNMYIIRNPPEFVNPFFEKSFSPTHFGRFAEKRKRRKSRFRRVHAFGLSLFASSFLSETSLATSSACISFCGTGTPSSTAFSRMESDSLTI